ncbi:hypothetical protein [Microvirga massiliensis]|uniref:hypothetical protein n=1 Tax=Microvirga massiliensis TaxID=1033741 RepID=UPI00062BA703|nr:hypothetical protein [Microvirga massiliensis]
MVKPFLLIQTVIMPNQREDMVSMVFPDKADCQAIGETQVADIVAEQRAKGAGLRSAWYRCEEATGQAVSLTRN